MARAAASSCSISNEPCQFKGKPVDPKSSKMYGPIILKLRFKKHMPD